MGWSEFLLWPLGAGAFVALLKGLALLLGRLMPRPPRLDRAAGTVTLSKEGLVRGEAITYTAVALLMVGAAARHAFREPVESGSWVPLALFLVTFFPVVGWMLLSGFRARVIISGYGVTYRPAWGATRHLNWEEITEVFYSKFDGGWVIRGSTQSLRLSVFFDGLELLWEALERHWGQQGS